MITLCLSMLGRKYNTRYSNYALNKWALNTKVNTHVDTFAQACLPYYLGLIQHGIYDTRGPIGPEIAHLD